ncbi:MAG: tetratricopeptide repeat protein [Cyclobacteriaceae bacterium]
MVPYLKKNDFVALATYHHNLGVGYLINGEFDLAAVHLRKGLRLDIKYSEIKSYDLPYDYLELGKLQERQNNFKGALGLYDSALMYIDNRTGLDLELKVYQAIYSVCDRLSEYKKGFINSIKYSNLRDSVFSVERLQNIGSQELQILLIQKDKLAQEELNRKKLIQYSTVVFFLLIVVIGIFYLRRFNISPKLIGSLVFMTILLFFEFVLVVVEPFLNKFTGSTPIYILIGNFLVAILFIPIHRAVETWFDKKILSAHR